MLAITKAKRFQFALVEYPFQDIVRSGGKKFPQSPFSCIQPFRVSCNCGQRTTVPIARLRLTGAPWLKRTSRPARGIAGEDEAMQGYVIASTIGTQDSTQTLTYEPPPGVTEAPTRAVTVYVTVAPEGTCPAAHVTVCPESVQPVGDDDT